MMDVVAGIIRKGNRVLIARRAAHKSMPGKWEFPGGKIEAGESPEQALERELLEEFGIQTKTGEHFYTSTYSYPSFDIRLICYYSEYLGGEYRQSDHDRIEWCDPVDMARYDFAEADMEVVTKLQL